MSGKKAKEARKLERRVAALEIAHKSAGTAELFFVAVGVLANVVFFLIPKTNTSIITTLLLAFAPGIPFALKTNWALSRRIFSIGLYGVFLLFLGWNAWPPVKPLHLFSQSERTAFVDVLKAHGSPKQTEGVWLGCPEGKEDVCLLVGQFIEMFKEAGWPVPGSQVQRYRPGQPVGGVKMVFYAPGAVDDITPGQGLWTKTPIEYLSLTEAFQAIGITVGSISGPTAPEHLIGLYFGPDL